MTLAPVRNIFFTAFVLLPGMVLTLSAAHAGESEPVSARDSTTPPAAAAPTDPALLLRQRTLTPEQRTRVVELIKQLELDDFDARTAAQLELQRFGAPLLPLLKEFQGSDNATLRSAATRLLNWYCFEYEGYAPTAHALDQALRAHVNLTVNLEQPDAIRKLLEARKLPLLADRSAPTDTDIPAELRGRAGLNAIVLKGPLLEELNRVLGTVYRTQLVPRFDTLVLTTQDRAARLQTQQHRTDWSALNLPRDEADRISDALRPFFPAVNCSYTPAADVFIVRGEERCIERAERLVALLNRNTPDALYDAATTGAPLPAVDAAAVLAAAQKPARLVLSAQDPLDAAGLLKAQGHPAELAATDGTRYAKPPYPAPFFGAAPVRLKLEYTCAAHALRWTERRTRFATEDLAGHTLAYDFSADGTLLLQLRLRERNPLDLALLGMDAGFLYPPGALAGAETDAVAKQTLLRALAPHLTLLPRMKDDDLLLFRGRLIVQGSPAALAVLKQWVGSWRQTGTPPAAPAWKTALDARLDAPLDWDGRGMSPGLLLPTLRKTGGIDLLLEESEDGRAPSFDLTAKNAELLPPGKHALRALLDELCRRVEATWEPTDGAITLRPAKK